MPHTTNLKAPEPQFMDLESDKAISHPADIAQAMIDNSFRVVPLPHGKKAPVEKNWVNKHFGCDDFGPRNGIGLKTGHGIIAIDIDYYASEAVEVIVVEFEKRFGRTYRRTGQAPKTALLARCEVPDKITVKLVPSGFAPLNEKGQSKTEQLEILTQGQQIVAYGVHPDTNKPYQWHGAKPWEKGDEAIYSFPNMSIAELNQFVDWVKDEYGFVQPISHTQHTQSTRFKIKSAQLAGTNHQELGLGTFSERLCSPEEVSEILSHIPTPDGYDEWWKGFVGIKSLGEEYYQMADDWSAKGGGYDPGQNRKIWGSAKKDGGITFKSVAAQAGANGADLSAIAKKYIGGFPSTVGAVQNINLRAFEITGEVDQKIGQAFKACNIQVPTSLAPANMLVVEAIFNGVFLSAAKSKFMFLNNYEHLNEHPEKDALKFFEKRFGQVFDFATAKGVLAKGGASSEAIKSLEGLRQKMGQDILDEIKYKNQRNRVEWFVDPFNNNSRIELRDDIARVVVTHRPYESGTYDTAVVEDFRQHFPEFDAFLSWLAASRFALDRKLAYLWMLLPSDFGKGFMMGLLKNLGAVVEMSVKEIEAAFEGKPLARAPEDFRRAIMLWVDEFKTVKSELKQLQSEMRIAPKYQLSATVQLYAKVFTSAESVASLVSEHGVEDQFANRMSILKGKGTIVSRPLYVADQIKYTLSIRNYMAETLNGHIAGYVELGETVAALKAGQFLADFAKVHGIGQYAGRISESIADLAEQFREYAVTMHSHELVTRATDGAQFLRNPSKRVGTWLESQTTRSDFNTLLRRVPEIIQALSVDCKGLSNYTNGREQRFKGVRIK